MAKKPHVQRTVYTDNNGAEWIFDCKAFKEAVDKKAIVIQEERGYKRARRMDVFRELGHILGIYNSNCTLIEKDKETPCDRFKKWYNGKNGPSLEIEDIHKMEEYFGCGLLIVRPGTEDNKRDKENNSMSTSTIHTDMPFTSPITVRADVSEARRNAARKVYGVVCDLIRMQQKMLYNYFTEGFPSVPTAKCVPEGFPIYSDVQNDIRKYGFDLSRELIDEIMHFVRGIYGSLSINLEEANLTKDDEYLRRFEQWLGRSAERNDFMQWCDFINEETLENYDVLDEIFDAYID